MLQNRFMKISIGLCFTIALPTQVLGETSVGPAVPSAVTEAANDESFWTGPWMGVHVSSGGVNYDINGFYYEGENGVEANLPDLGGQGAGFGIQAGYGFAIAPSFIAGLQVDASQSTVKNETSLFITDIGQAQNVDFNYSLSQRNSYNVTARLGYLASPSTQLYALAGFGKATFEGQLSLLQGGNGPTEEYEFDGMGKVLGAGIETRIGPKTSIGIEYRYSDLGRYSFIDESQNGENINVGFDMSAQSVRAVLNYRF